MKGRIMTEKIASIVPAAQANSTARLPDRFERMRTLTLDAEPVCSQYRAHHRRINAHIAALASALMWGPAQAHDWYPADCCSGRDCAPVTKIEQIPTAKPAGAGAIFGSATSLPSQLVITTEHGAVLVPENFPRRESHDGQWHACIRGTMFSPPVLICLFEPPSM
jgi:hypothetical protein